MARADPAAAAPAAVVAAHPSVHVDRTYDPVGAPITAAGVAERLGVPHRTIGLGEYRARLLPDDAPLPFQPSMLASIATGIRHGFLGNSSPGLVGLLDRLPTGASAVAADTAAATRPGAR
ncbi:hypothetical protein AB0469_29110 [Streptomyces sp. NPDC093801]|uniref:hypothetical protein n=1 Tax=Streptomyces sp. NPDC093801 TaxID=3155203 RepID=UPI00344C7762